MSEQLTQYITILGLSMTPVIELRGAIPLGLLIFKLSLVEVFLLAVIGNMIPNFFILKWFEPLKNFFTKNSTLLNKFYNYVVEKTHRKHSAKFNAVGSIFLITFVAIPLPGSGAWTGSLIAYLYGVPYKKALGLIFLGIIGGATATTIITLGGNDFAHLIVNLLK